MNLYDKKSFAANIAKAINNAYQKGGEAYEDTTQSHEGDFQASLSQTPMQPNRTSSPEITLVDNKSSDVQRRIDRLSEEEKALFNKFAINYLEDTDDVVNKMTRAVVNNYPQVFPDLYRAYSTLYTNKSTAPNIESASQMPVYEKESPMSPTPAPYAVANPSTGLPITKEDIKHVITELAVKPFGGDAVVDWSLKEISNTILEASNQYKVDPRLFLAQGIQEGHFGVNPAAGRSRKTRNFYNVGNVDSGDDRFFSSYSDGIRAYAELMNKEYNWGNKDSWVTPEMMIEHNFVRPIGGRYASAPNYTNAIQALVKKIDNILDQRNEGRRMVLVPNDNNNTWRIIE